MSIQIITGFSLNNTDPIDTRIVASGSTGRDAIPYKYEGLRVFDLSNNRPYVYVGATWSVEVSDQVSGLTGSIGKFTSSSIISDSDIYQIGTGLTSKFGFGTSNPLGFVQVGNSSPSTGYSYPFVIHKSGALSGVYQGSTVLGHNWYYTSSDQYFNSSFGSSNLVFGSYGDIIFQNKSGGPGSLINSIYISPSGKVGIGGYGFGYQPSFSLQVAGTVSGIGFIGSGAGLTNISPSSISNQNLLSAGSAITASNISIVQTTTNSLHYLTFVSSGSWVATPGSSSIRANSAGISYNPSTNALNVGIINISSQILTNLGSTVSPAISFTGDTNTGIYSPAADNLALVTNGVERFRLRSGAASDFEFKSLTGSKKVGLSVYDSGYTTLTLSPTTATQLDLIGYGGFNIYGSLSKSSGSFRIDHPLESKKSTHDLVHSFIEGPQADNIYRGKVTLNNGSATINLDTESNMSEGTFVLLNREIQCFTTNETGWTAVKGKVTDNILQINSETTCSDEISWMVIGERHDKHMYDTEWTDNNGKVIVEPLKKLKEEI
jgi:hypothetical protein